MVKGFGNICLYYGPKIRIIWAIFRPPTFYGLLCYTDAVNYSRVIHRTKGIG